MYLLSNARVNPILAALLHLVLSLAELACQCVCCSPWFTAEGKAGLALVLASCKGLCEIYFPMCPGDQPACSAQLSRQLLWEKQLWPYLPLSTLNSLIVVLFRLAATLRTGYFGYFPPPTVQGKRGGIHHRTTQDYPLHCRLTVVQQ